MKDMDELETGNGVLVVFAPVYGSVWVDITFRENCGEGKTVIAVDKVMMHVVNL